MSLSEAIETCRKCHRIAPLTNYNGNTFAAIARIIVEDLNLPAPKATLVRSLAGHIVAGVASEEELRAFAEFCDTLG